MAIKSNWYVITGGPSSGKSAVLSLIEKLGHRVVPEAARVLIGKEIAKGKNVEAIRKNESEFQRKVLAIKIKTENELPKNQIIFFDRAIPDSVAYYQTCGLDPKEAQKVCQKGQYRKVFLMERLDFKQDGRRTENPETVEVLNRLLREAYENLGCEIVFVPEMSPVRDVSIAKRLAFILTHVYS